MKNKLLLFIIAALSISLCACSGNETSNGDNANTKEIIITKEELETYSEYIELTTENWSDYIEVEKKEVINTDAFGEETGRSTVVTIGLKDGCYISEDNAMRIIYKYDGVHDEVWDGSMDIVFRDGYEGRATVMNKSTIFDITCEKIKGTILKLTIPNEKWNIDEDGEIYLKLDDYTIINQYTGTFESFVD